MEEENQVFGKNTGAADNNENLESEDFNFYHQNKEEAKKNIESSSKDLTDFIDSLIQDVSAPSEEDVNAGIEKILETAYPVNEETKAEKNDKKKKVTFKVLFIAALLSVILLSGLCAVGSSHNISIENGFVSFAKDTVQIVFFGEDEEEYITVDALLADLEMHGYTDILFPQEFVTKSDEYKVSVPEYLDGELKQVSFEVYNENSSYLFAIYNNQSESLTEEYLSIENAGTIVVDDVYIYIFEYEDLMSVEFRKGKYTYFIKSAIPYYEMEQFVKTIK